MRTVFYYLPKVSFKVTLCLYAVFHTTCIFAQDLVSQGLNSVEMNFHIKYEIPKGFNNLHTFQSWTPNTPAKWNTVCCVFESRDQQCKVLYNVLPSYPEYNHVSHRDKMRRELNSMLDTKDFVLDNYLSALPVEEAKKRFNADSVFLYNVPTAIDKDGKFNHCTRMIIVRQDRPILDLVWYFTDNGKKKEEKYIQTINKRLWYHDGDWNWDGQRWEEWMKTYFEEITDEYNLQIQ